MERRRMIRGGAVGRGGGRREKYQHHQRLCWVCLSEAGGPRLMGEGSLCSWPGQGQTHQSVSWVFQRRSIGGWVAQV